MSTNSYQPYPRVNKRVHSNVNRELTPENIQELTNILDKISIQQSATTSRTDSCQSDNIPANADSMNVLKSDSENVTNVMTMCDKLITTRDSMLTAILPSDELKQQRIAHMNESISKFEEATFLLGYFSRMKHFDSELNQLNAKLISHRQLILDSYIDIIPQDNIKSLSIPSYKNKMYEKGILKFDKARNYIIYRYKQKICDELAIKPLRIEKFRNIISMIVQIDKHYDIYQELIVDLQKKNSAFDRIMNTHMHEFVFF